MSSADGHMADIASGHESHANARWANLDIRVAAMFAITMAGIAIGAGVPTTIGIAGGASFGIALAWVAPAAALLIGAGYLAGRVYHRSLRYRVTDQRLERQFRFVVHTRRSLARDRIRTVDMTANPLHRVLGLAALTIGTGQHNKSDQSQIKLDPLARPEAERLRVELLAHATTGSAEAGNAKPWIASLRWSWLKYAPVSFVAPAVGAAAFGAVLRVSEWFGMQRGVISWLYSYARELPLLVVVIVLAVIALFVGAIGSIALWIEMWWSYRLVREPGTLRVHRGLFTARSISIEERRLRGVDIVEPIGIRLARAARVDAVVTGMRERGNQQESDRKTLLPAAPLAEAHRVAAEVLGEEVAPTAAVRLLPHPIAARGRRFRWALGAVFLLVAVLVLLGILLTDVLLHIAWISALILIPIAVALALDAYRNLGHGITGAYLVTRSGAVRRSTAAIARTGIIGWQARQSIFQRKVGLITLTATTAAGAGGYSARDVGQSDGLAFAEEAVPDLFGPFLERTDGSGIPSDSGHD